MTTVLLPANAPYEITQLLPESQVIASEGPPLAHSPEKREIHAISSYVHDHGLGALITHAIEVANGERSAALIARPDSVAYFKNFAEKQRARAYNLQGDRSFYKRWHTTIVNNGRAAAQGAPNVVQQRVHFWAGKGSNAVSDFWHFIPFHVQVI